MNEQSFSQIIKDLSAQVSYYRQSIFTCFIYSLVCSSDKKCISAIWSRFSPIFCGKDVTKKRFYTFLNSSKLPWKSLRLPLIKMMEDRVLTKA